MGAGSEGGQVVAGRTGRAPRTVPVGACPLCGAAGAAVLFQASDRLHGTPGDYTYRRCARCRTVFQDPQVVPEDLGLCYPGNYYTLLSAGEDPAPGPPSPRPLSRRVRDAVWRAFRAAVTRPLPPWWHERLQLAVVDAAQGVPQPGRLGRVGRVLAATARGRAWAFGQPREEVCDELLPRRRGHRRALDVGCGSGFFMVPLARLGWEVEGTEWDARAAAVARQRTGRPVRVGDFLRMDLGAACYDLIVLRHVFEHLSEPVRALRRMAELLAPGGRAVILSPNPDSLSVRVFGADWFPWEVPRHLVLATGPALAKAAAGLGLEPVRVRTWGRAAAVHSAWSRAYRARKPVDETNYQTGLWDRGLAMVQRVLTGLGLGIGEEIIVVLQKCPA